MTIVDIEAPRRPAVLDMPASRRRRIRRRPGLGHLKILSTLVTVAVLVLGWAILAPPQLGGSVSYVVTYGVSMLPKFRAGDLVVVRSEPTYHVGEVAAYHNGQLGVVVLHQIVAIDGSHYVFKGENNDFRDSYEPTKSQIIGAEWIHLPGAGRFVEDLRDPLDFAVLVGLLWLYSFSSRSKSRRQRRRHRHAW